MGFEMHFGDIDYVCLQRKAREREGGLGFTELCPLFPSSGGEWGRGASGNACTEAAYRWSHMSKRARRMLVA
jgi:hypothetical protein